MRARYRWMVGSLMALAMSSAWAGGGRIDFSGAIVVPTCAAQAEAAALAAGKPLSGHLYVCGGHSEGDGIADAATYALSTQRLDNAAIAGSPLLQYLVGYRTAAHAATAQMLTRTYE